MKKLTILIILLSIGFSSFGQTKVVIAVFDHEAAVMAHPDYSMYEERLNLLQDKYEKRFEQKIAEIQEKYSYLNKNFELLSEDKRTELTIEVQELQEEASNMQVNYQREISNEQQSIYNSLSSMVQYSVERIAQRKDLSVVIKKDQIHYYNELDVVDITPDVITDVKNIIDNFRETTIDY